MGDRFSGFAQFLAELRRRRVFRVAAAYAVVGWVVIQGSGAILPTLEAPLWVGKVVLVLVALGFVLTVALAWAFDVTPTGVVRTSDVHAADAGEPPGAAPLPPSRPRARALVILGSVIVVAVAAVGSYAVVHRRTPHDPPAAIPRTSTSATASRTNC